MKHHLVTLCAFMICIEGFSQKSLYTKCFNNDTQLGGEAAIKKMSYEVEGAKVFTSFELDVPSDGAYYLCFWLCPPLHRDATYADYLVTVDGKTVGRIAPAKGDWQAIGLEDDRPTIFHKGLHKVSVIGDAPDVPAVEFVRMSRSKTEAAISDAAYKNYKMEIKERHGLQELPLQRGDASVSNSHYIYFPLDSDQDNPPYDVDFALGETVYYTFFKLVYFYEGQDVFLYSFSPNPNYTPHVLEFFNMRPVTYSWSVRSGSNGAAELSVTIPETGLYYVKVRSYDNGGSGLCNVSIGDDYYHGVPVTSYWISTNNDTTHLYNHFTCYSSSDPVMWVEEGTSNRVADYNDDYFSQTDDYDWWSESRIVRQYSDTCNAVHVSSYSSNTPACNTDIYLNCKAHPHLLSSDYFDSDNYIISAPQTGGSYVPGSYNCISWSGGIHTLWVWPPFHLGYVNGDDLAKFDYFYGTVRYSGSSVFTRLGATEENSSVDLWATVAADGTREYTHASVRKGADNNAHGFDWESKCGSYVRTYHPRYRVPWISYGQVVEHYRRVDSGTTGMSLEESVANGLTVVENVSFTAEESSCIDQHISGIPISTMEQFNSMFDRWENVWDTSVHSNPDIISDCDEYRSLLSLCNTLEGLKYAVYKKLGEGHVCAVCLVRDLTLNDNQDSFEAATSKCEKRKKTKSGVGIFRSTHAVTMLYVKEMLSKDTGVTSVATGLSYSNSDEFTVSASGRSLTLRFTLDSPRVVLADVIDLDGNIISNLLMKSRLEAGSHVFGCTMPGGTFLVRYIVDGNINVKKISIK